MDPEQLYGLGAFALGALHAFEPGHGKTIMAAYLVGTRGRPLDAIILGIVVTFTHTFTIILLAVGLTFAAEKLLTAHVHVILQTGSGAVVLAVGLWMLWRQSRARSGGHAHAHVHPHSHGGDAHVHRENAAHTTHGRKEATGSEAKSPEDSQRQGVGGLIAIGVSGGLVPCPGAIAVLLAAVNRGQVAAGLVLTLFFSLGTACALVAIGLALVTASEWAERRFRGGLWHRWAPLASAVVVTLLGLALLAGSILHVATPHDKMKETFGSAAMSGSVPAVGVCRCGPAVLWAGRVVPRYRESSHPHARSQWAPVIGGRLLGGRRWGADAGVLWRMCRDADRGHDPRATRATQERQERGTRRVAGLTITAEASGRDMLLAAGNGGLNRGTIPTRL